MAQVWRILKMEPTIRKHRGASVGTTCHETVALSSLWPFYFRVLLAETLSIPGQVHQWPKIARLRTWNFGNVVRNRGSNIVCPSVSDGWRHASSSRQTRSLERCFRSTFGFDAKGSNAQWWERGTICEGLGPPNTVFGEGCFFLLVGNISLRPGKFWIPHSTFSCRSHHHSMTFLKRWISTPDKEVVCSVFFSLICHCFRLCFKMGLSQLEMEIVTPINGLKNR